MCRTLKGEKETDLTRGGRGDAGEISRRWEKFVGEGERREKESERQSPSGGCM